MKTQTKSVHTSGSFVNWMMSNNKTLPVIGKGATELMWSDRIPYQVTWVSDDKSECIIQPINAKRIDKNGMSESQDYDYSEIQDYKINLVWRNKKGGCWCIKSKEVRFIPKFRKQYEDEHGYFSYFSISLELQEKVMPIKHEDKGYSVIENVTKVYTNYNKINILFGYAEKYHDFSF
tara:strand:+ start:160 stop:690 length:531 start_codon:yes stop_codon:yes gene_type:complete